LVVVKASQNIIISRPVVGPGCVGREGASDLYTVGEKGFDSGGNDSVFFLSEETVVPGVRIEATDSPTNPGANGPVA
jgi:hypothetical protein